MVGSVTLREKPPTTWITVIGARPMCGWHIVSTAILKGARANPNQRGEPQPRDEIRVMFPGVKEERNPNPIQSPQLFPWKEVIGPCGHRCPAGETLFPSLPLPGKHMLKSSERVLPESCCSPACSGLCCWPCTIWGAFPFRMLLNKGSKNRRPVPVNYLYGERSLQPAFRR